MVQDDPERKLDAWLDEALARYSAAEPHAGLEKRVLERLQTEKRGLSRHWWKVWAPALAAAAALIVVTVVVQNRDVSPAKTVPTEIVPVPAAGAKAAAEERQLEVTTMSEIHAKPGTSTPRDSTAVQAPGPETVASSLTTPKGPGSTKAENGGARAASSVALSPHPGRVFPVPSPLSQQERLAMAAVRSGLLSSEQQRIPPGDEPLPQVVIQEISIRPLQKLEPI